jgi:uncharacterized membrane protein
MAKDLADVLGAALGRAAHDTVQTIVDKQHGRSNGALSGAKGLAAGAGLATLAPLAARGAGKMMKGTLSDGSPVKRAGKSVTKGVKGAVGKSIEDAGGAAGIAKEAAKDKLPGGSGKSSGVEGVGKGRRMPVQQAVDVPVPVKTAYNQWTQFEEWPKFMHRVDSVTQEDETHLTFKTKIWGISKEFHAEILEQRPDERIKWRVAEGMSHSGVVTFHEIADRLTRIELNIDVEPGSFIEKAARGMRHVKRAVRADLHRFKAYVTMEEEETGAWRGAVDDGKVKSRRSSRTASSGSRTTRRAASSHSRGSSNRSTRASSSSRKSSRSKS